jgi:HD superfamily phosphohydrolase
MRTSKRIRTVLYGDQRLSSAELEVLHTPAMQRLYGLRQLGFTDRVFIDASHARIHHVVGVLNQVDKLVSAITHNLKYSNRVLRTFDGLESREISASKLADYVEKRKPVVRFIGLLHDLTHAPFGHTIEDEIRLVESKHDHPDRQADAFFRLLCQLVAWLALETLGPDASEFPQSLKPFLSQGATALLPEAQAVGALARRLISSEPDTSCEASARLTSEYLAEMLAQLGCAMTALLHLQVLHEGKPEKEHIPKQSGYKFTEMIKSALAETKFSKLLDEWRFEPRRDAFMLDIVGNTVCADLLDNAGRDSHYSGLKLDYDSGRIAENFTLVEVDASAYALNHPQPSERTQTGSSKELQNPFEGWCLRTAISLVSRKFRTDVPSELMNLLNVRYYLYERVIFHPTKCAAGSMLGTALQLLGWRETSGIPKPMLPAHLRFVGDDVFLHDICAALNFVEFAVSEIASTELISDHHVTATLDMDRAHSGLVPTLLRLRVGQVAGLALEELRAAKLLLDRLSSRRYFRPVFRALPNSRSTTLQAGPEALADVFRDPDRRYKAEREIERRAMLPVGTITIHCPNRSTARKIANVFLTKPDDANDDQVCKLKDIASLDPEIFGKHEAAVKAVEEMYGSMWRLSVHVAPEHVEKWRDIGKAAGTVIFEAVDNSHRFSNRPDRQWPNDPHLERELSGKTVPSFGDVAGEEDPALIAEGLSAIGQEIQESGWLKSAKTDLYNPSDGFSPAGRALMVEAFKSVLCGDASNVRKSGPPASNASRTDQVLTMVRTYVRVNTKNEASFTEGFGGRLDRLTEESFTRIVRQVREAVDQTKQLELSNPNHKGFSFREFTDLLNELLMKIAPTAKGLFGEETE